MERRQLPPARYEYGAEDFVFVELDEEMSLEVNFKTQAITRELERRDRPGIVDVCPANASYLIRLDPDELHPDELIEELKDIEATIDLSEATLSTRIVDIPTLYDDPWTRETMDQFPDRRQDPDVTDLEYAARINGFDSPEALIESHTHSPFLVTMVGFVPGVPWCYQLVPREEQIEVPKYLRPRTDTPRHALGHGGCFTALYSVRGAGGYQLFGRIATPMFDRDQRLEDFRDSMIFPRPGDIFRFRKVDREEYDGVVETVEDGSFTYNQAPVAFDLDEFLRDPHAYNETLMEELYGDD